MILRPTREDLKLIGWTIGRGDPGHRPDHARSTGGGTGLHRMGHRPGFSGRYSRLRGVLATDGEHLLRPEGPQLDARPGGGVGGLAHRHGVRRHTGLSLGPLQVLSGRLLRPDERLHDDRPLPAAGPRPRLHGPQHVAAPAHLCGRPGNHSHRAHLSLRRHRRRLQDLCRGRARRKSCCPT